MKKIIILTLLITNNVFNQDLIKPEFNKLGDFYVNKTTTEIIKNLEIKYNTKTKVINDLQSFASFLYDLEKIQGLGIYQITENKHSTSDSPLNAPKCPKSKFFKIKGLEISDILIKDLELVFYDDTLININCSVTDELLSIIRLKYGKGQTTISKEIDCTEFIEDKKIDKYKIHSQEIWIGAGLNTLIIYTNWQCLENLESYKLSISSDKYVREFLKCELDIEEKREAKKISDF